MLHAPLSLLRSRNIRNTHVSLRIGIDLGKVQGRAEVLGLPCLAHDAVELVNLFEGKGFGFVDHEPTECLVSWELIGA
jgi:hypothetical protein